MSKDTLKYKVKCIKNTVNSWYINTLNFNMLFVLKRHTNTLNDIYA